MTRIQHLSLLLLVSCLPFSTSRAEHPLGLDQNFPYGILTEDYESPHVKWAKPYSGGPIRTLVMAPEWSQRETIELAQRLSIDYTAWMTSAFSHLAIPAEWFWYATPAALMDQLLREHIATDFDVIVVGKLEWSMLPAKQRFDLLKKVSDGTGLVYICPPAGNAEIDLAFSRKAAPEGVEFISRAIPFAALPQLQDLPMDKIVRAGRFGTGRIVALDYGQEMPTEINSKGKATAAVAYPALTPQWETPGPEEREHGYIPPDRCPEAEFVPYEYYQSLVARAVIWAGGRNSAAALTDIALPATLDYPAASHTAVITAESAPTDAILKSLIRARHEYDRVYEIPAQQVSVTNQVTLPELPAGEYIFDVWLLDAGGNVFDWRSQAFTVTADIAISEIALSERNHHAGDLISGTIHLSRVLAADEALAVELWDNYGRRISEQTMTENNAAQYSFALSLGQPLTILHSIIARIHRQGAEVSGERLTFPVRAKLKKFDDFNEIVWSSAENQFLTHLMLRKLATEDQTDAIDVGWRGATHARNIAAADLAALPYTARFGQLGGPVVPVATAGYGCMTHPETFKQLDEWGALQSNIYGPYGPIAWTHGDETNYSTHPDTCWSETCLSEFRRYLEVEHEDLASLNREWRTEYKSWTEVMPITYEEAVRSGNYAPWLQHRLAQQLVFARFYQYTGTALAANDPGAHAGFDGPLGDAMPNAGINWWLLKDYVGKMHAYINNSQPLEIIRSFARPEHLTGVWYGTYGQSWQIGPNTVEYHHFFPWYSLLHGLNSTWFWTMGAPGPYTGYAPDFSNMPFMQASRDALAEIRGGTGKLLLAGTLQDDQIAIHYSEGSKIADSIFYGLAQIEQAGVELGTRPIGEAWFKALADFNKALEHNGLQYRYVAYEEVEEKALVERGYKVFIMPHSRVVSAHEAEAIRQFVDAGGLLIADILPGILNGFGNRQEDSMLADLFPSREPGTVNRIGQGRTVLLGDALSGYGDAAYRSMQGWGNLDGRHKILGELLEEVGITPQVQVRHRNEGEMPPTEIFRVKSNDIEYVGLLREYFLYDHRPYPATITFPRKSHLYDMRNGAYLGFTDRVETILSHEAHLYALLPYRVRRVVVAGPANAAAGAPSEFNLKVQAGFRTRPGTHAFRIEVLDPDHKPLPWYAANLTSSNGEATYAINWALNEKAGRYLLRVRDIASNVLTEKTVNIR